LTSVSSDIIDLLEILLIDGAKIVIF